MRYLSSPLLALVALAGLAGLHSHCNRDQGSPPIPSREVKVEVGVSGCATRRGTTCMRPPPGRPTMCEGTRGSDEIEENAPTSVVIWSDYRGSLEFDGQALGLVPEEIDGGFRWRVDVPTSVDAVQLRCDPEAPPCWSMTMSTPDPEPALLVDARKLRFTPVDPQSILLRDHAIATLEAKLSDYSPWARGTAFDVITDLRLQSARAALDLQERRAAIGDALRWTTKAWNEAKDKGELGRASCHARRALLYALRNVDEPEQLRTWRQRLLSMTEVPLNTATKNDYYIGILSQREGDLQTARIQFLRAERGAHRFDDWPRQRASLAQAATVLAGFGQEAEVEALFERVRSDQRDQLDCLDWLMVVNNHAWSRYLLADLGRPARDPWPDLDDVLLMLGSAEADDPCYSAVLEENARLNLGLVMAERGWTGQASHLLEAVLAGDPLPRERFWVELLKQRLVLARGDRGELSEWVMRDDHSRPGAPPEQRWLRHFGRGQVFEALALPLDAIGAYEEAERALDSMMRALDFDTARERLLRGRQRSAGRLVALLVEHDQSTRALCIARHARRRTHDALDRPARIAALNEGEHERWREALDHVQSARTAVDTLHEQAWLLPTDEIPAHRERVRQAQARLNDASTRAQTILYGSAPEKTAQRDTCEGERSPGPDEIALLYFPIDRDERSWQGFAFDGRGIRATTVFNAPEPLGGPLGPWSAALLLPFADVLDDVETIQFLPTGRLWTLPFAALPFEGDVLLAHASVVKSLDLAPRPVVSLETQAALVVGDPQGDLPAARREAQHVRDELTNRGWAVTSLLGKEARVAELRTQLPRVDLLHYAGHAQHEGSEGWGSALRLADNARLEVRDVLALPRVPSVVMLPACDTASTAPGTLGGGMSVARAFLLAGADVVVASEDQLDDRLGLALAEALYAEGPIRSAEGPAALRRALLTIRPRFTADAWWPIVALVP